MCTLPSMRSRGWNFALVEEALLKERSKMNAQLKLGDFDAVVRTANLSTCKFILDKQDYDHYKITPYNTEVTEELELSDYVNAAMVETQERTYFVAQMPKPKYCALFKELLRKSGIKLIVSLIDCWDFDYFCEQELVERRRISLRRQDPACEEFFYDEVYDFGKTVRRLRYPSWIDYASPDRQDFQTFYDYFRGAAVGKNVLVHCHAGVGRSGTFIMYDMLSHCERVDLERFLDTFMYLRACKCHLVFNGDQLKFLAGRFL